MDEFTTIELAEEIKRRSNGSVIAFKLAKNFDHEDDFVTLFDGDNIVESSGLNRILSKRMDVYLSSLFDEDDDE